MLKLPWMQKLREIDKKDIPTIDKWLELKNWGMDQEQELTNRWLEEEKKKSTK